MTLQPGWPSSERRRGCRYRTPLPESQKIAGFACFYNERADIYLDGELQATPASPIR